ncbi:MAG: RelA/SpoT family protein [Dysgonamonadaceae bacterium]|jgi:GTP pyrophosphokinase|nr:RelA/SpoT family protein [Dysgonamonadaceae bacterium]
MKETEDDIVEKTYQALLNSYAQSNHRKKFDIIEKAFKFAEQAHKGVKRRSGQPYITHPLAVAMIVSEEMGLGSTSIVSALLHDVVEDADYTVEDIRSLFGDKIAQIVDGLTKISGGIFAEAASAQAENMRKLLLTMSSDIRVILIKMADRLHNMRTLNWMLPAKQYKIAGETMYLYAPLAHRLGLFAIKTELEDLSFKYEHPEEYKQIEQKLEATKKNIEKLYSNFAVPVDKSLRELGYEFKMQARLKSVYSIWNKMQAKKVGFEDIYDVFAVRVVFEPKPDIDVKKQCWEIYSAITNIYKLRPDRIRDWVSQPKANGYQALHVTVMGPDGHWIEIQIRTTQMDEIAEKGFAAHWKYKHHFEGTDVAAHTESQEDSELDHWLKTIQDILEAPSPNAMDFLDTIKLNLYSAEIFVFTPKGEIKTLPQSATALDFAYAIHSKIGDHCIGAKVNHKLVPLSHKLDSGDQIEILTSKAQQPKEEWLNFVTTAKAKTKIQSYLRKQVKAKIKEGEEMLENMLQSANIEISDEILNKITTFYKYKNKEAFYYALAHKQIELPENLQKIIKGKSRNIILRYMKQAFGAGNNSSSKTTAPEKGTQKAKTVSPRKIDKKKTYTLKEEEFQKNFITKSCCSPIPGDDVFGYIRDDERVEVHKMSCNRALKLKSQQGDKIISCKWDDYHNFSFLTTVQVEGFDRLGILNDITRVIAMDMSVNMRKLTIESNDGFFEGTIAVYVHDVADINTLLSKLRKIKDVKSAIRID